MVVSHAVVLCLYTSLSVEMRLRIWLSHAVPNASSLGWAFL